MIPAPESVMPSHPKPVENTRPPARRPLSQEREIPINRWLALQVMGAKEESGKSPFSFHELIDTANKIIRASNNLALVQP